MSQLKGNITLQKQVSDIKDKYSESEMTGVTKQIKQQVSNSCQQSNKSSNFSFSVQESNKTLTKNQIQKVQTKNNQSSIQSHQISSQLHESTDVGYLEQQKILTQIQEQPKGQQNEQTVIQNYENNLANLVPNSHQLSKIQLITQNQHSTSYSVLFELQFQNVPQKFKKIIQPIDKQQNQQKIFIGIKIRLDYLENQEQSLEEFIQILKKYERYVYEIVIDKRTSLILIDRIFQMQLKKLRYVYFFHKSSNLLRDDHGLYFLVRNLKGQPREHNKKLWRITLDGDKISQKSLQSLMAIQFPEMEKVIFKFSKQMIIKMRNKIIIKVLGKFMNYKNFESIRYYINYPNEQHDKEIQQFIDNKKLQFRPDNNKKSTKRPQEGYWLQKNGIAKYITFDFDEKI